MDKARLIVDPPGEGAWNMAVDQALLETANSTGLITLRFYGWSQPTLSLGYFQDPADRKQHPASLDCPLVRRRTGGGAILHHHELTYSLCVPSSNRWSVKNEDLYEQFHRLVIDLLQQELGVSANLYREAMSQIPTAETGPLNQNSFMCFHRRSPGDVVLGGAKIVGSAQRRLQKALLQHGSLLLNNSPFSPELRGINDLCEHQLGLEESIKKLVLAVNRQLRISVKNGMLSPTEIDAVNRALETYFDSNEWTLRRGR